MVRPSYGQDLGSHQADAVRAGLRILGFQPDARFLRPRVLAGGGEKLAEGLGPLQGGRPGAGPGTPGGGPGGEKGSGGARYRPVRSVRGASGGDPAGKSRRTGPAVWDSLRIRGNVRGRSERPDAHPVRAGDGGGPELRILPGDLLEAPPGGGSPGGLGDQAAAHGCGDRLHAPHGVHADGRGPDALPVPGFERGGDR